MTTFLTIEYAPCQGITLQAARHLTDEEKSHYNPEYRDIIFVCCGESIELPYVRFGDMPSRSSDGSFSGCGNNVWIISQEELDEYLSLNAQRDTSTKEKNLADEVTSLQQRKADAERVISSNGKLPTAAEAAELRRQWILSENEGDEGFVPHFWSQEEYECICERLSEIYKIKQ